MRAIGKEPRHFARGLQVPLGIGGEQTTGFLDRCMFPDAGHDIVQGSRFGGCIERIIDSDQGDLCFCRKSLERREVTLVPARPVHRRTDPEMRGFRFEKL